MGKIYIDTVKYVVKANIEISGLVEKPDVVGAIFGQTEGLLGEELDLRELQKNGRIGRIEVNIKEKGGRSLGTIEVPSSLDVVETSIIAAALETVDRVGPCEASVKVDKVEDTRNIKRKKVIERAKELVKKMLATEIPERKEIADLVRSEVKIAEISSYGPDKLPAGPNLDSYESIILVEGRADVINLLKSDIINVIAVGGATGATLSKTIINLCKKKEATLFVDGDRGGDIIMRGVLDVAEIDYIAKAPPGKEVEELARKEIIKILRTKVPVEQIEASIRRREGLGPTQELVKDIGRIIEAHEKKVEKRETERREPERREPERRELEKRELESMKKKKMPSNIESILSELGGTLKARIYDEKMDILKEVPVSDITKELDAENMHTVIFDGIITQRLIDMVEAKDIKIIAGVKIGNVFRKPEKLEIYVKEE